MSRYSNKKFDEIVKAKISPLRNAVISRTEKIVRLEGGSVIEKGYLIAQQMEVTEGDEVTKVFIKGGSLKLSSIKNVVALRDALNTVLEVEGYEERPKHTCKCEEHPKDECNCNRDDGAPVSGDTEGQRRNPKKKHRPMNPDVAASEDAVIPRSKLVGSNQKRERIPVPEPEDVGEEVEEEDYTAHYDDAGQEEVDTYYEDEEVPEEERDGLRFEEDQVEEYADDDGEDQGQEDEDGGWEY